MDETIGLMPIKPADLSVRLKRSFRIEPTAAVRALEQLIEETLALVETHVPQLRHGAIPRRCRKATHRLGRTALAMQCSGRRGHGRAVVGLDTVRDPDLTPGGAG
jgi:hypothetical protein